jgi:hypothetical protein
MRLTALLRGPGSQADQPPEWPFRVFVAGIFLLIVVKALIEQSF